MILKRSALIALEIVAGLLGMLVLGGGLLAWRLTQQPLEVGWLTPYVEQALNQQSPVRIGIGGTVLGWAGFGQPLEIRAREVTAFGASGGVVAAVPELRLNLSLPGLLHGRVAPTRLELVEPRLYAQRTESGEFRLDVRTDEAELDPDAGARLVNALVEALRRPPDPLDPLGALTELRITNARLEVDNRQIGLTWSAPKLDLSLRRNAAGMRGEAALDVDLGGRINQMAAEIAYNITTGTYSVRLDVADLRPAEFAALAPVLAPLGALEVSLAGSVTVEAGPDLVPRSAVLGLSGGKGQLVLPDRYPAPVAFEGLKLTGRLDEGGRRLSLDRFELDFGRPRLIVSGTARREAEVTDLALKAEVEDLPMADLARLWPAGVGANVRSWMVDNMTDGVFDRTSFELDGTAPADDPFAIEATRMQGRFALSGFTVHYRKPLPPAREVTGTATFDGKAFDIALTSGKLLDMQAGPGRVLIYGLETSDEAIDIRIPLSGPLSSALTVLDHEPLGYARKVNLTPKKVGGTAKADLHFAFPLIARLTMDDVKVDGTAKLTDVAVDNIVADIRATQGQLDLTVDSKAMHVEGTAQLNGVPATVAWDENFPAEAPVGTQVRVQAMPNDAERARFNLDFPDWLNGPAGVDMTYIRAGKPGARVETIDAQLDLTPSTVRIDVLNWIKRPGLPGRAEASIRFVDGKPLLFPSVKVQTAELRADGRLELDARDYHLKHLVLDNFRLGSSNARLELRDRPDGGLSIDVRGQSFDARPFRGGKKDAAAGAEPQPEAETQRPLDITFDLDQVVMGEEGQTIRHAVGRMERDERIWRRTELDAQVSDSGHVRVRYVPEGESLSLSVDTDDAGATLRELGVLSQVRGGAMTVRGRSSPEDPKETVVGTVEVTDYQVQDAPVLARILAAAGPQGFADFMAGKPMGFTKLTGAFHWHDSGISLREIRTSGSQVGLTLEGNIDLKRDKADLQGTIVPFSTFNKLLGVIPLLGEALVGGEGQGLFAATYRVTGPLDNLSVGVNPLAVLAPGFLRNLFFLGEPAGEEARKKEKTPAPRGDKPTAEKGKSRP